MKSPSLLEMTAPLREDFSIPYHDLGPAGEAPKVALVSGLHGDELNGIFVLGRLASFLARVAAGEQGGLRLRRRVLVVPAVNVLGVNTRSRRWPFDGTDVNRMFPGYDAGETTQRIAWGVLKLTREAIHRVDIHASNLDFEELPQVRLYAPSEEERSAAALFGLPAVIERPLDAVLTTTLVYAWREVPGHNFVIQVGQAGLLQAGHCERLFRSLVGFLGRAGILEGVELAEEEDVHHFGPRQTLPLISDYAGLFVSRLQVGTWVRAGDTIGQVYDGFSGETRAEIRAPVAGLLSGLRRGPLLCQGDLVARIQTRQPADSGLDSHLHGQGQ